MNSRCVDIHGVVVKVGDTIRWLDTNTVHIVKHGKAFNSRIDSFYALGDDYLYTDSPILPNGKRIVKPKTTYSIGFEIV